MPKVINTFGTNPGSDAVIYFLPAVAAGVQVTTTKFREIETAVNLERVRRGSTSAPVVQQRFVGLIEAADLNFLKNSVEIQGRPLTPRGYYDSNNVFQEFAQAPAPTGNFFGVDPNVNIFADDVNNMMAKVNAAGAVCVCNCNYCTCNCNYCTCDCNYSCTCQCNYTSDIRLKTSIKLVDIVEGLNVYSFSYVWNTAKTYIGVMAQELLGTKYEDALSKDSNGYYQVNYSKLPVKMIEA